METDPRAVFERLFGTAVSTDPTARLARIQRDRSILDSVTDKASQLRVRLAPADRTKLSEYLEAVRDVERRIQKAEEQSGREVLVVDQPAGIPSDFADHARMMMDLLATSRKLVERGRRTLMTVTGIDYQEACEALERARGSVKTAIVMVKTGLPVPNTWADSASGVRSAKVTGERDSKYVR